MEIDALGAWGEFIGGISGLLAAVGVIATLLYLARQVQQNTNSVEGATEPMSPEEQRRYLWCLAEFVFMAEGLHRQHKRGLLSMESWAPIRDTVIGLRQNQLHNAWWEERSAPLSGEFRDYIAGEMAASESQWSPPVAASIGSKTE
jgi:hypothetical protein